MKPYSRQNSFVAALQLSSIYLAKKFEGPTVPVKGVLRSMHNHDLVTFGDSTPYNYLLVQKMQVSASRIRELRNLATEEIFLDFPVVLCSLTDVAGIAVVGDDFFWQFILLDPTKVTTEDGLQEAYLHEVAHLLCGTNKHDLCFSVVLNIIRRAAHFELSAADSDYRDCLAQGITLKAGKQLSAKLSVSACKCLADSFTCANIVKACIAYICWDDKIVANMSAADLHSYIENFDLELVE